MAIRWLRFRRGKQTRPLRPKADKSAKDSEQDAELLNRIAAGIALNKFPPG
jgi:hypothetical protein